MNHEKMRILLYQAENILQIISTFVGQATWSQMKI